MVNSGIVAYLWELLVIEVVVVDGDDLRVEEGEGFLGRHAIYRESEVVDLVKVLPLYDLLSGA